MKSAVIVFPGSNCDRDAQVALRHFSGQNPHMVWHREPALPQGLDAIMVPGGFSYGDYLRCGAIAARSPIMADVVKAADRGVAILGVCNGFQVLCEAGLLPGALIQNAGLNFVCRPQDLTVANTQTQFTSRYQPDAQVSFPIAHHEGNYRADEDTLDRLEGEGRVAFRYAGQRGNPNGSARDIAGILNENGNVLGMMPHPERAIDAGHGGTDGCGVFEALMG